MVDEYKKIKAVSEQFCTNLRSQDNTVICKTIKLIRALLVDGSPVNNLALRYLDLEELFDTTPKLSSTEEELLSTGFLLLNLVDKFCFKECYWQYIERICRNILQKNKSPNINSFLMKVFFECCKNNPILIDIEVMECIFQRCLESIEQKILELVKLSLETHEKFTLHLSLINFCSKSRIGYQSITSILHAFFITFKTVALGDSIKVFVDSVHTASESNFYALYPREYQSFISLLSLNPNYISSEIQNVIITRLELERRTKQNQFLLLLSHFPQWQQFIS